METFEQVELALGPLSLASAGVEVPVCRSGDGRYFAGPIPRDALGEGGYGYVRYVHTPEGIVPRLIVWQDWVRITAELPKRLRTTVSTDTIIRLGTSIDPETGRPFVRIRQVAPMVRELYLPSWIEHSRVCDQPGFWTVDRRHAYNNPVDPTGIPWGKGTKPPKKRRRGRRAGKPTAGGAKS